MHRNVAVKKLTDPFKTATVAKHMFREIKLLKQLQHENVCLPNTYSFQFLALTRNQIIHLQDIFISSTEDMYAFPQSDYLRLAFDPLSKLSCDGPFGD